MIRARKFLAGIFTVVLLISLLGLGLSVSANQALAKPPKVQNWLNGSGLYKSFLNNEVTQAEKAIGSNTSIDSITISNSVVKQAAAGAFNSQLFQQSLNTFVNSNYNWLEGKSSQPNFMIDLTNAKQSFANQIGGYVQEHLASLPICNAQQLIALQGTTSIDPLNATCRPPTLDPQTEATSVTQKIESSGFLSNPVITANNFNPNGNTSKPYYEKLSSAPKIYKFTVHLPWIYGAAAVLSVLFILLLLAGKRKPLRRIGIILAEAGIVLIVLKFLADTIVKHIENHIFNQSTDGQLQAALTKFFSQLEHQMIKVDFLFGVAYVIIGVILILIAIFARRQRRPKTPVAQPIIPADESGTLASRLNNTPREAPKLPPQPLRPPEPEQPQPPKRRPPRLIQ